MDSDLRQNHAKEVRPLVGARGDQKPAVASSLRDELARGGPLLFDEELGARLEVVEDVLLVADGAGVAPGGAVLAAAAEVGDGDDAAVAQGEDGAGDGEGRLEGDVEAWAEEKEEERGEREGRQVSGEGEERKRERMIFVEGTQPERGKKKKRQPRRRKDCSSDPKNSSPAFASLPPQSAF